MARCESSGGLLHLVASFNSLTITESLVVTDEKENQPPYFCHKLDVYRQHLGRVPEVGFLKVGSATHPLEQEMREGQSFDNYLIPLLTKSGRLTR